MDSFDYENFTNISLPIEADIISQWGLCSSKLKVSVICLTYNHCRYIHDAIRGFLIQKTNFQFEIIIHDDASNDGTVQILMTYAALYPNIIKLILQKENQYSKAPNSIVTIPVAQAQGQYIAFCEGDDFWIKADKLQKQIDFLSDHPDHNLCFHLSYLGNTEGEQRNFRASYLSQLFYPRRKAVIPLRDVIMWDGGFIPTASIIVRSRAVKYLPAWFEHCDIGDYYIQTLCSYPEGALFLPERMSFYRVQSLGSWSERQVSLPENILLDKKNRYLASLVSLNEYFGGLYSKEIGFVIDYAIFSLVFHCKKISPKLIEVYRENRLASDFALYFIQRQKYKREILTYWISVLYKVGAKLRRIIRMALI